MENKKIIECTQGINESRREWFLRGFKGSVRKLKRITNYKVWQDGNHLVELRSEKFITRT